MGIGAAHAQYPGHIGEKTKQGPVLRSVAVLEWTGEPGKPSASRLVPVCVFHDGKYEDGGLYLDRPEPMALGPGTEYQLQETGLPQGLYDVVTTGQDGGGWIGYGVWKPWAPPAPAHPLKQSVVLPELTGGGDEDDRRPHFRKTPPDSGAGGATPTASNPPEDPDRPRLSKRPENAPDTSATANPETAAAAGDLETTTAGGDPDRPKLSRGAPKDAPTAPRHLEGTPPGLEQMIAVSDAADRPQRTFRYSWPDPNDREKMQTAMEDIAQKAIAKAIAEEAAAGAAKPKPVARTAAPASAAHRKTVPRKQPPPVTLTDVRFRAFELTYGQGATLVFSARTDGDLAAASYVTLIAQPDIYGVPQVLYTQVTKADDLDASPRLRLVDAVDAAGDTRGDLLFELRGNTTRQFAIYRVAAGRVDQMVATAPIPVARGVAD